MLKTVKKFILLSIFVTCVVRPMEYFYDDLKTNEQKMQSGTNNNSTTTASNQPSPALANNNQSPELRVIDVESFNSSPNPSLCTTPEPITKRAAHSPSYVTKFRYNKNETPFNSPIVTRKYDLTPQETAPNDEKALSKKILALIKQRKEKAQLACCDKTNLTWEQLMAHLNCHPRNKDNQFYCCGKSFSSKTYAADHVVTKHNNSTLFDCPNCPKKFYAVESLRVHYVKCIKNLTKSIILIPEETNSSVSEPDASINEKQVDTPNVHAYKPDTNTYVNAFNTLFSNGISFRGKYAGSWQEMVNYFQDCTVYYKLQVFSCPACPKIYDEVEDACCCYLTHLDARFADYTQPQNTIDLDEIFPLDSYDNQNTNQGYDTQSENNTNANTFTNQYAESHASSDLYVPEIHQPQALGNENYHWHPEEYEFLSIIDNAELAATNVSHDYSQNVDSTWPQGMTSPDLESYDYTNFDFRSNTDLIDHGSSQKQDLTIPQPHMIRQVIDLEDNKSNTNTSSVPVTPIAAHTITKTPAPIEIPDRKKYEHAIGFGLNDIEKIRFERLERERLRFFAKK